MTSAIIFNRNPADRRAWLNLVERRAWLNLDKLASKMDLKLAQFSGKAEDFPIWRTKFLALMQTKGLFSAVMGRHDTPHKLKQLVDGATAEQRSKHETKGLGLRRS